MLDDAEELEIRQVSHDFRNGEADPFPRDTHRARRVLIRLGVRYGQGFFLGAPSPEPVEPDAGVREILAGLASRVLS